MVVPTSDTGSVHGVVEQEARAPSKEEVEGVDVKEQAEEGYALNTMRSPVEESPVKDASEDKLQYDDDDLDETELESPLPGDIFSLIYVSEPRGYSFFYSLAVYIIQMTLIVLILFDLLDLDSDNNKFKIPPGVSLEVTIAQCISMVLAVATQTNLLTAISRLSMRSSYDHNYVASHITPFATLHDYTVGVALQLVSGIVMLAGNFILNMQSYSVLSLLLNFAALSFVSEIQDVAFWLARNGFVSNRVREDCMVVTNFRIPRQHRKVSHTRVKRFLFGGIAALLLGCCIKIALDQRAGKYLCKRLWVQFGDGFRPDLPFFSGLYEQTGDLIDDRVVYKNEQTGAFFAYCQTMKAWTFAGPSASFDIRNGTIDATAFLTEDPCGYWVKSEETETYDITATRNDWNIFDYFSNQTLPVDTFVLVCIDCAGLRASHSCSGHGECIDNACVCESYRVGITCEKNFPCGELMLDQRTEPFPYSAGRSYLPATNYNLLLDNSSSPVMVYNQPVYAARVPSTEIGLNVILFTGRRWGLFLNLEFDDASLREKLSPGLQEYLQSDFHTWVSKYRVYFFSDPMDYGTPSDNGSPAEHRWFKARRWLSVGERNLYRVDLNQPLNTVLLCPVCIPFLNDCINDGECSLNISQLHQNAQDVLHGKGGRCVCDFGYSGGLCEHEETCLDHDLTCLNGGNCTDLVTGRCSCPIGFTGGLCQYNLSSEVYDDDNAESIKEWIIN